MKYGLFLLFFLVPSVFVLAQDEGDRLRAAVTPGGEAYIYHTATPPLGYGFNIYRQDEPGDEFIKLNDQPLFGAASEEELRSELGNLYYTLLAHMDVESGDGLLLNLRGNRVDGLLYTFLFPEVAHQLARLYVDENAHVGETATYKFVIVDPLEQAIRDSLMQQVELQPHTIEQPADLTAENEGETVTLRWNYTPNEDGSDDKVVRFNIFRLTEQGDTLQVNNGPIIRNEADTEQAYSFSFPPSNRIQQFFVRPYDITGQAGPDSPVLEFTPEDDIEPRFIDGVEATALENGTVVITWPISTEHDVNGYNIYRARSVEESAPLTQINTEPLGLLENTYEDTTLTITAPRVFVYRVTAVDSAGNESEPSSGATVQVEDIVPPPSPTDPETEYLENGAVELQWEAPAMPGDFRSYVVMRRRLGRQEEQVATRVNEQDIRQTAWTDTILAVGGPIEGTKYEYTIAAADSARNTSEPVSVQIEIPNLLPPSPPASFRAQNDEGIRVEIRWGKPDDPDINLFTIYRTDLDGENEIQFRAGSDKMVYWDEEVELAQRYIYRATTTDVAGNESSYTDPDTVFVRNYATPRRVRNVRAEATAEGVVVKWEPVPDSDLAGYRVFRSSIATGTFESVTEELITDREEFIDPDGEEAHWYRVRAYNTSTNESLPSEPAQAIGEEE